MPEGLSIAAIGMKGDMQRLATISQNLVNAATPGFKRDIAVGTSFSALVMGNGLFSAPVPASAVLPDLKPATLRFTGNALDVAIESAGFFEVRHEGQTFYTRQGNFAIDATGRLVTQAGHAVAGSSGDILLSTPKPVIDAQGNIVENGKPVAQLKLVRFSNPSLLQRSGDGLFLQGGAAIEPEGVSRVRQSHLEVSNVNTAAEMVRLIETMRHFEAGQKVIQMIDAMNERAISKLGEF
ncbi:flagellar hook-basal body protein [Lacisediminimonas sp.]|uniref:flagellar hook-basal body protein n=1 Tax=Lacisediminimonas sp. TaxID=3060582 RepID=UPI002722216F|nr:flagellar hook basal-body protein [Lacisediminimonas sp.]MDO8299537.1 flagellar hook basal-body protein [Lacisediminimonas sp.]